MPANIHELLQAFSLTAQTSINLPSTNLIRMNTTSSDLALLDPVVETDATEIGKGNEFASQTFLTNWKVSKRVQGYLCSEMMAIMAAYGLGSGNAGTYVPIDPVTNTNEIELPWMTLLEQVRPGSNTQVLDRAFPGMIVNRFRIILGSGPGRANSRYEMDLVGTGQYVTPSGMTMPNKTNVNLLPAASLTATINGTDYITAKTFESFEFEWDNKVREGYFPGSGFQIPGDPTSGQLQGRMEFGVREIKSHFMARFQAGSTELATLIAQTQGTAVLTLAGAPGNSATINMPQCTFKTAQIENQQGIITVRVDLEPLYATSTGLVTITVLNTLGTVGRV